PCAQVSNVVEVFMRHGFQMTSEVTSLLAGTKGSTTQRPNGKPAVAGTTTVASKTTAKTTSKTTSKTAAPDTVSIATLNQRVQAALTSAFPDAVWVHGEVLDYDKNKDRKHVFFTLAEKQDGADEIAAQASTVLFERTARILRSKLENAPEPVTLQDGIEIRALVRVELYPQKGRYQLIVEDIDPSFTLGKMALTREQILQELRQKNLDQRNSSLPLPIPPLRVGVLTSPDSDGFIDFNSDGFIDFKKEIESSGIGFQVTCYAVKVQGPLLQPSVLAGLRWFEDRADEFDVVCIVRGGGSRTDLAWFDNRDVALAVATHPTKIVCGIGHQRDQSVLDMIAHSEKTPTAVGAFLVQQVMAAREQLAKFCSRLLDATRDNLEVARTKLTSMAQDLRRHLQSRLGLERQHLADNGRRLGLCVRHSVRAEHDALTRRAERIRGGALQLIAARGAWLTTQEARQRLLDPRRVLDRGYALARDKKGKIITGVDKLQIGMELGIEFRDGRARTTVDDIQKHDKDKK
ncbi:MAG: exodeoxyribonuclease VII large subunit, partial [Planctomycetota bacterium]